MNVSQLQQVPTPPVQHVSVNADKESNFLSIKLLNKRSRVRLSPRPLNLDALPGRAQLFAVANSQGWFAAITQSHTSRGLICSPLSDLRDAFNQPSTSAAEELPFTPKRTIDISNAVPNVITFACSGTRLVVGLLQGEVVIFDTAILFTPGSDVVLPLHTFPSTTNTPLRQIVSNPAEMPFVALIRERVSDANSPTIEVLNLESMQSMVGWRSSGTPVTTPVTLSWSPKGKQLAIGMQSGEILTFDPSDPSTPKTFFPRPPTSAPQTVLSAIWLANPTFYAIYMPTHVDTPDIDLLHFIISLDSKKQTMSSVTLVPPCLPFPGLRPPSAFPLVLRNWGSAKFLMLVGDSASSDIGAFTCTVNADNLEEWRSLSLEETTQPAMPLDNDTADTVLVGLELDLTSTQSVSHTNVSGAEAEAHPSPIMYAYASDGTVLGWHLINLQGGAYPGMVNTSASGARSLRAVVPTDSGHDAVMISRTPSTFDDAMATSAPPSAITATSAGQFPGFGQSQFERTSAFGQPATSAFAPQASSQSAFGQTGFPQTSSAFQSTSAANKGGFSAFSTATPSKFGQVGFGFGPPTPSSAAGPRQHSDEAMMSDVPSGFGGMSVGEGDTSKAKASFGSSGGIFGQAPSESKSFSGDNKARDSSSGSEGLGGLIKPATGFGTFSTPTSQPQGIAIGQTPKPAVASAFGKTGFNTPTFGKSGFGQASGFGSFASVTPASASTSGGFSAFAQAGPTSFLPAATASAQGGNEGGNAKPAWAAAGQPSKGTFGSGGAFTGGSAFGSADTAAAPAFGGAASSASSSFPQRAVQSAFGTSAFGGFGGAAEPGKFPSFTQQPRDSPGDLSAPSSPQPVAAIAAALPPSTLPTHPSLPKKPEFGAPIATPAEPKPPLPSSAFLKPAAGFGAFGSTTAPNTASPFFNPPSTTVTSAFTAFTGAGAAAPRSPVVAAAAGSAAPTFGAPSALGQIAKPVFGSPSTLTPAVKSAATPVAGAFSQYIGTASGFGAFAGPQKSFGELLKASGDDAKDSKSPALDVGVADKKPDAGDTKASQAETPGDSDVVKDKSSAPQDAAAPTPSPSLLPSTKESTEADTVPSKDLEKTTIPKVWPSGNITARTVKSDSGSDDDDSAPAERFPEDNVASLEPSKKPPIPEESSISSLSISSLNSFVEVTGPEQGSGGEEEPGEQEEDEEEQEESQEAEQDEEGSSAPETLSSESRENSEDELSGDETPSSDGEKPVVKEAADIPLPATPQSRSPSTTPRPTLSTLAASESPLMKSSLPARAASTTPPGSPVKPSAQSSIKQPAPVSAFLTPAQASANNASLGRLSTRPARSSPLSHSLVQTGGDSVKKESEAAPVAPVTSTSSTSVPKAAPDAPSAESLKTSPESSRPLPQQASSPVLATPSTPSTTSQPRLTQPSSLAPASSPTAFPPPVVASTASPLQPQQPTKEPTKELGMQTECANLIGALAKELEQFRHLAQETGKKCNALKIPHLGSRTMSDMFDNTKWGPADYVLWGTCLKRVVKDIGEAEVKRQAQGEQVKSLKRDMLKAGTRKEEIVRFDRARYDEELAKLLKVRTLGPEHLETQTKLRRDIRMVRDRIQKLEGNLECSKRKVCQYRAGRSQIRPPSLDIISRTYRNIDTVISQQADSINALTARISKVDLSSSLSQAFSERDLRLSNQTKKPVVSMVPNVAVTTAAALNAERSAQNLKQALLAVRKEPLLNSMATPGGATPLQKSNDSGAGLSTDQADTSLAAPLDPPFSIDESPTSMFKARRTLGPKLHSKPIPFKNSPASSSSAPSAFDWGPLPSSAPMTTLSSDVRKGTS